MRWHLLNSFDSIYIYDLHGNSKKRETAPDGSKDENVFDIMQGVAIIIAVKTKEKSNILAPVYYLDSYGKRDIKYKRLWESNLETMSFQKLNYKKPDYFFVPKDFKAEAEYNKGIRIKELFPNNSVGVLSHRDSFSISTSKKELEKRINDIYHIDKDCLLKRYQLQEKNKFFIDKIKTNKEASYIKEIQKINYRIFDKAYIIYNDRFVDRTRKKVLANLIKPNLAIITQSQTFSLAFNHIFISDILSDLNYISNLGGGSVFPLYIYDEKPFLEIKMRKTNLEPEIIQKIEKKLGLKFVADHEFPEAKKSGNFSPLDLLDYIYAVLHSPNYREKYQEFLKIDFPRVPYPEDKEKFKKLVKLGSQLRETHLLQGKNFGGRQNFITNYDIQENNLVEKIYFDLAENSSELGRVYINKTQYFGKVPKVAWDFFIGGYQPAQKWLKDRKDRTLSSDDIEQYQKIILALKTTSNIMPQIDPILFS